MTEFMPPGFEYTDHSEAICKLRQVAMEQMAEGSLEQLAHLTAADLLEAHDETGISLDNWAAARALVEYCMERRITENGV